MNQFKKPLAMLLALVMLCGAFLSDGKLAFAEGDPIIDVTEGEKPDGTPVANVLEAGNPAGDPTPEPTQEPAPEYTVTFVVGEGKFPVTVAENGMPQFRQKRTRQSRTMKPQTNRFLSAGIRATLPLLRIRR